MSLDEHEEYDEYGDNDNHHCHKRDLDEEYDDEDDDQHCHKYDDYSLRFRV